MERVFREIESMGVYDPLIIKLDRNMFYKVGYFICCDGCIKLDKNLFNEGNVIQHPNTLSYWKIKSVSSTLKYCYFRIE